MLDTRVHFWSRAIYRQENELILILANLARRIVVKLPLGLLYKRQEIKNAWLCKVEVNLVGVWEEPDQQEVGSVFRSGSLKVYFRP